MSTARPRPTTPSANVPVVVIRTLLQLPRGAVVSRRPTARPRVGSATAARSSVVVPTALAALMGATVGPVGQAIGAIRTLGSTNVTTPLDLAMAPAPAAVAAAIAMATVVETATVHGVPLPRALVLEATARAAQGAVMISTVPRRVLGPDPGPETGPIGAVQAATALGRPRATTPVAEAGSATASSPVIVPIEATAPGRSTASPSASRSQTPFLLAAAIATVTTRDGQLAREASGGANSCISTPYTGRSKPHGRYRTGTMLLFAGTHQCCGRY